MSPGEQLHGSRTPVTSKAHTFQKKWRFNSTGDQLYRNMASLTSLLSPREFRGPDSRRGRTAHSIWLLKSAGYVEGGRLGTAYRAF
ncbi:hypothetical protein J6590_079893 [Homalodisca vitripennis]|nr:hypothetical protein J6590_079893 [Homalodisca vitripennis]